MSRKIDLNLKYRSKPEEKRSFPENKHIPEYLLRALVALRYPQGMNRTDTRTWSNIMDAMDEATKIDEDTKKSGPDAIEMEKSDVLWLLDVVNWCLDNSKIPPMMASWVNTLLPELEEAKTRGEPKLEAVKKEKRVAE